MRKGDLAYNMMRMWQGASGLAGRDSIVSPAYVVVIPSDAIDPTFASYWFKSVRMIYLFWAYSYGITGDRLRLYYKDFARISVTLPPKSYQVQIGETLAAADRVIAQTKDLIAAKRHLKRGLTEQLLSGSLRVEGGSEPWTQHKFADFASLSKKRFDPKSSHENRPCIELEHLSQGDGRLKGTVGSQKQHSTKAVFERGDVLYGKLRPNLRKSYYCEFDGVCSTEMWVLKTNAQTCCGAYLAELVQTDRFISAACVTPDYSWDMLIRASNPAFSCGRSPVSLEPLSIRLNRLKNRTIEPVINRLPARGTVTRRQVDFPVRNPHRFGPFHGPDASSVHYPGAQDTRASLFHNRFQSVAP